MNRRLLASAVLLFAVSGPAAASASLDAVRNRLLPRGNAPHAVWMAGHGMLRDIPVTQTFRFDGRGRFVFDGSGPVAHDQGYDGNEVWLHDHTGNTRTLGVAESHRVLFLHWLLSGYWADPDAPIDVEPLDDADGTAFRLTFRRTPMTGKVTVARNTGLPAVFTMVDGGLEHEIRFNRWDESLGRPLPAEVEIRIAGDVNALVIFDTFRGADDEPRDAYAPPPDMTRVSYTRGGEGVVKSKRGKWGHHFVRPMVDGKDVGWFAFDTGARMSILDDDVAEALGLQRIGELQSGGVGGPTLDQMYKLESIELGPVRMRDIPVMVSPMEDLSLGLPEGHVGIIGMDLLWNSVIDYDQARSVIALYNPAAYELDAATAWEPLLDYNGKPSVMLRFEGHEGLFTIDTGNPGAVLISPFTVERLALLDGRRTTPGSVGGFGGRVACEDGRLAWVEWGRHRFDDVPASFVTENRGAAADVMRDGIIGTDLLRRFRVILDIQNGRAAYLPSN